MNVCTTMQGPILWIASTCLVPGSLPVLSPVCKGGQHGARTTSQFFPVTWSGDNFILSSLHLLCTWKLVLLLFVGFFNKLPF